ncbi:MAG: hypothetical protein V7784_05230 [Oceanospirillaceae bacterium]
MTKFSIDHWATQGSQVQATALGVALIERQLLLDSRVMSAAAFIGQSSPRFYVPVDPQNANSVLR